MNTIASFVSLGILATTLAACTEASSTAGAGGGGGSTSASTSSAGGASATSTTATTTTAATTTTTSTSSSTATSSTSDASSSTSTGAGGAGAGGGSSTSGTGGSSGHPGSAKVTEQWVTDYCTAKTDVNCANSTDVSSCSDFVNSFRLGTDSCTNASDAETAVTALEKLYADCTKVTVSDMMCDATDSPTFVDSKCAQDDIDFAMATFACF